MLLLRRCLVLGLGLMILWQPIAYAKNQAPKTPEQVVRETSNQLLGLIKQHKARYKQHPDAFFTEMTTILSEDVVDYDYLARGVMGRYTRQASDAQLSQFQKQFKRSLLAFYGKALLSFNNQTVRVLPTKPSEQMQKTVPVSMQITDQNGVVYPIIYTMVRDDTHWKVRNFVINGINVGKLFRSQFQQAMQTYTNQAKRVAISKADAHQNTLDFVVTHWVDIIKLGNQKTKPV